MRSGDESRYAACCESFIARLLPNTAATVLIREEMRAGLAPQGRERFSNTSTQVEKIFLSRTGEKFKKSIEIITLGLIVQLVCRLQHSFRRPATPAVRELETEEEDAK